jgi:hypothetical protein
MKNILSPRAFRAANAAADEFAHCWRVRSRNNGRPLWNELKKPVLRHRENSLCRVESGPEIAIKREVDAAVTVKKAALAGLTQKKWVRWQRTPFLWAWDFACPVLFSHIQPMAELHTRTLVTKIEVEPF